MRRYILIAIGGFVGAILRFLIRLIEPPMSVDGLPINTLIINIAGSLLLGFFITVSADALKLKEEERLGITAGFLGAFTTFSTISKEIMLKIAEGSIGSVMLYLFLTVALGLTAVFVGAELGQRLMLTLEETED